MMSKKINVFKTTEAEKQYYAAYETALQLWPIPYAELYIQTRFGVTHVIASGPNEALPLVLLHPAGSPAVIWYRNVAAFSRYFRVYAVDVIGEVNKSMPSVEIQSRQELADWVVDLFDGLGIESSHMVGNSFGGFLTLNAALYLPERLKKIVLISPAASFVQIWAWYRYFFPAYVIGSNYLLKRAYDWIWQDFPIDECLAQIRAITSASGIPHHIPPSVLSDQELRQIKMPTLLLIGDREVIYEPRKVFERASQLVTGIKTELIKNANHNAEYTAAKEVNEKILDFLVNC
jgi:pimeloyl-ACP methyl ester carboxylesterase